MKTQFKSLIHICFSIYLIAYIAAANSASVYDRVLKEALFSGDSAAAEDALKNGAYMPDINYSNFSRLPLASMKIMIKNGYDLNNEKGVCIVSTVMRNRKLDADFNIVVNFLLESGANVNCIETGGATVLFLVSADRDEGDIESDTYLKSYSLVLSKSTQINVFSKKGDTVRRTKRLPIDAAIRQKNKKIFKMLVDAGSPLNESSAYQLDASASNLKFGEDWNNIGWTPLEAAIKFEGYIKSKAHDTTMINYILKKGADINHVNNGRTALDFAHNTLDHFENINDIEIYLLKSGAQYSRYKQYNASNEGIREEYTFSEGKKQSNCGSVSNMYTHNYTEIFRRGESFAYLFDSENQCAGNKKKAGNQGVQDAWLVVCQQRGRQFRSSSKELAIERAKKDCVL